MKPAGRELDALIAEKVMGYQVDSFGYIVTQRGKLDGLLPEYSTDIAAAWEVLEKLKERCSRLDLTLSNSKWLITLNGACGWISEGTDTAPHAICLAAVKAMGVDAE